MDKNLKDTFSLNLFQWNSQSLRPKLNEFSCLLHQEKIHIAIISETWLEPESSPTISKYNIYRTDRPNGYGGVAVITHKSIKVQPCQFYVNNTGIELIHIKLLNCHYIENIISVYCPSSINTTQSDWDDIFTKFPKKSIIAGDFNGHHIQWSYKSNIRGTQLLDSCIENGYIAINNGAATRIKLVNNLIQETSPDITFVSSDIAIQFNWQVTSESLGSDHMIIKYSICNRGKCSSVRKRNFIKADWLRYQYLIENQLNSSDFSSSHNVQFLYDNFVNCLNTAADSCIPQYKICKDPTSKFKPKTYWSPVISEAVAKRRLALKVFRRNPTPLNYSRWQKTIVIAKKLIREAKFKSWQTFCDSIDEATTASDMWRRMRWYKGIK
ncbi:unnamed protein product [Euphydryas editha]|uniref:Endonuclease/exonuclease/phosphatase domain-containing protein n=1 Tax=Euphydryas editha TaxID=104508 RepID=A0AAU9TWR7_EUPED|nr:unnamed protein product [Euphydryas editha]